MYCWTSKGWDYVYLHQCDASMYESCHKYSALQHFKRSNLPHNIYICIEIIAWHSRQFWKSQPFLRGLKYIRNPWIANTLLLRILDTFYTPNCTQQYLFSKIVHLLELTTVWFYHTPVLRLCLHSGVIWTLFISPSQITHFRSVRNFASSGDVRRRERNKKRSSLGWQTSQSQKVHTPTV